MAKLIAFIQLVQQAIAFEQDAQDNHNNALVVTYDTLRRLWSENGMKLIDHLYGRSLRSKQTGMQCLTSKWKALAGYAHPAFVYRADETDKQIEDAKHHTAKSAVNGIDMLFIDMHENPELFVDCETHGDFALAVIAKNEKTGRSKNSTQGKLRSKKAKAKKKLAVQVAMQKQHRDTIALSVADILESYAVAFVAKSSKTELIEAGINLIGEIRKELNIEPPVKKVAKKAKKARKLTAKQQAREDAKNWRPVTAEILPAKKKKSSKKVLTERQKEHALAKSQKTKKSA